MVVNRQLITFYGIITDNWPPTSCELGISKGIVALMGEESEW